MTYLDFATGWAVQNYYIAEESLAFAQKADATHFYVDAAYSQDAPENWSEGRIARLLAANTTNLKPILHGNFKVPLAHESGAIRRAAVEYVNGEIDFAARIGAPLIVHGSCIMAHRNSKERQWAAIEDYSSSLASLTEYARERGVALWVENLECYVKHHPFYTVFNQLAHYEYIFSNNDYVGFMFDVGHDFVGGDDPANTFKALSSRVVGINLHDNNGSSDAHMMIGDGAVNFGALIEEINAVSWRGIVVAEVRSKEYETAFRRLAVIADQVKTNRCLTAQSIAAPSPTA